MPASVPGCTMLPLKSLLKYGLPWGGESLSQNFALGVRKFMCSDNRFYTLAMPWRSYFHIGAIPNLPCCVWNVLCLARGQNIPYKGEGDEIISDQSVNLCHSGFSCGHFYVAMATLDMVFQWDHWKIKLLLNYILLTVLNWVKVGTWVLKLWVEMLVLEWHSKCCLDKIHHFKQIFQVHVSILLNMTDSTLWHCSQSENKKGDPVCECTGYLFFLDISSWREGCGITVSSWHEFEAAYLMPFLAWHQLRLAMWAEKWDLRNLNHPCKMQCGSSLHEAMWWGLGCRVHRWHCLSDCSWGSCSSPEKEWSS